MLTLDSLAARARCRRVLVLSLVVIACCATNASQAFAQEPPPVAPPLGSEPGQPPPVQMAAPPPPAEPAPQLTTEPPPARNTPEAEASQSAEAATAESADTEQDAEKPKTGWVPGSGFIVAATDDEAYKLRIGLQWAGKAELIYRDGDAADRTPFFVVRPIIAGNLFKPWIQFWTSMELARNPPFLLDSYVDIKPWSELGIRVGQQYTPFSRHESYGPQQLLFPEWAPVAEYFWSGRDKGITVLGLTEDSLLEYYLGFYGGSPLRQFTTIAGNYVLEARLTVSPMGPTGATEYPYIVGKDGEPAPFRVSFTIDGWVGKVQSATENFNPTSFAFVAMPTGMTTKNGTGFADIFIQAQRFVFLAEAYYRHTQEQAATPSYNSVGVWGQAGYMLVTNLLDVAARVNWLDPSNDLSDDVFKSIEGEFNYYISAPNLVLKLRYGYGNQKTPGTDELGPVRLAITPGKVHLLTLQLNLAF